MCKLIYNYTQGADALKRRSLGGENAVPSKKQYIVGNDIIERRWYASAKFDPNNDANKDVLSEDYSEHSLISLLGGSKSAYVVDTQMLGIVTI